MKGARSQHIPTITRIDTRDVYQTVICATHISANLFITDRPARLVISAEHAPPFEFWTSCRCWPAHTHITGQGPFTDLSA